jgi:hypothetical protein
MTKTLATGSLAKLKNNIDTIAPCLYADGVWTVDDIDADNDALRPAMQLLHKCGAVEHLGLTHVSVGQQTKKMTKWRWTDSRLQGKLQEHYEDRDTMPCGIEGHTPHIHNHRDVDGLTCKHCVANGNYPEFEKEEIKDLL